MIYNKVMSSHSLFEREAALADKRRIARGVVWAGLAVAILSGWFVVTRLGLRHEMRIWDVVALRFGEGALILTPVWLFGPARLPARAWLQGVLLAVLWGAPFILLVAIGLQLTTATLTSTVTPTLMPVFAGFIAWALIGETPSVRRLGGYALIVCGLLALVYGYVDRTGPVDAVGAIALVAAAVLWALYTLRLRRTSLTPLQAAALICFWSAAIYLPVYFALGLSNLAKAPAGELAFQSLYQGIMMSVVAIYAFNRAVASLGARAASAIIALVPVTSTALAVPVLDEWPPLISAVAICVIALGVIFAAVRAMQESG
ncbi:DMT family transporter [Bradyrhizobium sp. 139]|uniref:DMT family transporter n=1 Tax=Bradyrhizobium sp. 139 TaxID=2782616 RepID=UPI001FF8FEEA|nr:DMT family transporter [Bradyrhizobium sp. 139]MCK1741320.1 DMT family transporter [Bradyrhizobium sp. 139]